MPSVEATTSTHAVHFGPFCLSATERLLSKDGTPVELGARALDILIALAESPNQIISKRELMTRVWSGINVDESSLRVHIALLRKTLADGKDGARYIATVAGRGYCFVAPVTSKNGKALEKQSDPDTLWRTNMLPTRLVRIVGRADGIAAASTELLASRFLTIVGPGGVGKTTLAVAVAHDLVESFVGSVVFVDLGMLNDPGMVAASLASTLGISVHADDPTPTVVAYLRPKRILLVFDNCEHVISSVAVLASQIFRATRQVHVLTTSREALRADGETVYKLEPLTVPPENCALVLPAALTFSAIQLFIERVASLGARLTPTELEIETVATICRRLDGIALAIELAASRVGALGLQQTAAMLDQRLTLLWQGQRTAPPRQKTLQATLDWSYRLLTEQEQTVLRRLAAFMGDFSIEAAEALAALTDANGGSFLEIMESLVAKSIIAARPIGSTMQYRLLETTRAYLRELQIGDAERKDIARRHAAYCLGWLKQTGETWPTLSDAAERAPYLRGLGDVRAALEWCFGLEGDLKVGIDIAVAAVPLFSAMSLLTECYRWAERGISALTEATRGGTEEMHLQAALGLSLMFTRGSAEPARDALNRSLRIAEKRDEILSQLQLLAPLTMYHLRVGDFRSALGFGRRASKIAKTIKDDAAIALAHSMLGISLTHTEDIADARRELELAHRMAPDSQQRASIYLGFGGYALAGIFLAKTLWLQGCPEQAIERAHQALTDAVSVDHPVPLSITMIWAILLFLWIGDLQKAEDLLDRFIERAQTYSLRPYLAAGRAYKGVLTIRRGDPKAGVETLRGALEELHATRYELLTAKLSIDLAEGLAALGRCDEALAIVGQAMAFVEDNGDLSYLPEMLRVKANIALAIPQPQFDAAETCLTQSLERSRLQGALAWELRAAMDLAKLSGTLGRNGARAILQPVYNKFSEGFETPDLRSAERLLAKLP